jgi:hypothetical protein
MSIDEARLARALHEANVDCDYSRRFDRKSCSPEDGPHMILARSIAAAYGNDVPAAQLLCTFAHAYSEPCGLPESNPIHPGPDERMGHGKHVFRHETTHV